MCARETLESMVPLLILADPTVRGYSPCPTGEGTEVQGTLAVGTPPTTRLHPRAHPASFIFPTRHF